MQQRELGTSGLHISTIGLGSWAIGGWMWGTQDDAASEAAIHAAVDHGILGVTVTGDQANAVWSVIDRLNADLAVLNP